MKIIRLKKISCTYNITVLSNTLNREILNCIEQCVGCAKTSSPDRSFTVARQRLCPQIPRASDLHQIDAASRPSYSVVLADSAADINPLVFRCLLFSRVDSSPTDTSLHRLKLILILPRFLFFCWYLFYPT